VTRPRQTLEALFLDIVERARADRLETSGIQHGGQTASFLKGEEGEALIDRLVKAESPAEPVVRRDAEPAAPAGPDRDLISSLTREPEPEPPQPSAPARAPKKMDTSEVDLSVIDSLIDPPDKKQRESKG
jgi:hypothetical protein